MDGWTTDGWIERQTNEPTDGWMDGWMDGWTDGQTNTHVQTERRQMHGQKDG